MSRLSWNIIYNVAGQSASLVLGLVAVRFVYRDLGDDEVGLVFFALTAGTALTAAMDSGLSSTVVREVAGRGDADRAYIDGLLRTAASVYWGLYLCLAAVVLLAASGIVNNWLNLGSLDAGVAAASLQILAPGLLLALPRSLYASLLRGQQRMGTSNAIDATAGAAQQAGIVLIIAGGGALLAVSWWIAASSAAWLAAYLVAASRLVSARALLPGWSRNAVRANRRYSSSMALVSLLGVIHTHSDKLIASRLLPLGVFGLYAFGFSALSRGMIVTSSVAQAALPSLAGLYHSGNRPALLAQYLRLQDFMCYATVVVFAAVPFVAPPILTWLFDAGAVGAMLLPCTLLALGFYMNSTLNMPHVLSLAVGKPGIALSLNAYALVVVLPVTILLIWRWALVGAALSWVVYHVFAYSYAVPRLCRECADGETRRWYLNVAKFAIPAAVVYGTAWFAAASLAPGSWMVLSMAYLLATAAYGAIGWRMLLPDAQRSLGTLLLRGSARRPAL